ncbi:MAG TPA: HAMP domain-containing sensor histidine kinase [Dongiaceae bacterium]|jgi:signal transduction histidine kinase
MASTANRPYLPPPAKSLSARVLLLTVFFVMLGEILIYAPSAGRFRYEYLRDRLATAHTAVLALLATPDYMVSDSLQMELLQHANAYIVALKRPDGVKLMMHAKQGIPAIDATFDLNQKSFFGLIGDAFATIVHPANRVLRVMGSSPRMPESTVEIVIDEQPMRAALLDYSERVLELSIVISLMTASLVYLSLQWLMIRPMRRLTESMVAFRSDPENASLAGRPSRRSDEIGVAERELVQMQAGLRTALQQKTRLAALGGAVNKINHDLRNILATARLVSDRLLASDDPTVRRNSRALLAAIDRAVELCSNTLNFTREGPPVLEQSSFSLAELIEEVSLTLPAPAEGEPPLRNEVPENLVLEADRSQVFRIFTNLTQNAVQSGATRVEVTARHESERVVVEVSDNGPGLPPRARDNLFQPFAGSARPGGSGLGLAIVRELVRAHGGNIRLLHSTAEGTAFAVELPQRSQRNGQKQKNSAKKSKAA